VISRGATSLPKLSRPVSWERFHQHEQIQVKAVERQPEPGGGAEDDLAASVAVAFQNPDVGCDVGKQCQ